MLDVGVEADGAIDEHAVLLCGEEVLLERQSVRCGTAHLGHDVQADQARVGGEGVGHVVLVQNEVGGAVCCAVAGRGDLCWSRDWRSGRTAVVVFVLLVASGKIHYVTEQVENLLDRLQSFVYELLVPSIEPFL